MGPRRPETPATSAAANYGREPQSRYSASKIFKVLAALRSGPALTDDDFIAALLAHANATPETIDQQFAVVNHVPRMSVKEPTGAVYPLSKRAKWIAEWQGRLELVIEDQTKAIKTFRSSIERAYNEEVVWFPMFRLEGAKLDVAYQSSWSTTESALWHAMRLLVSTLQENENSARVSPSLCASMSAAWFGTAIAQAHAQKLAKPSLRKRASIDHDRRLAKRRKEKDESRYLRPFLDRQTE